MSFAHRGYVRLLLASASIATLGAAGPALAQTQVASASQSNSTTIETVTVTATRRALDEQKVGVSLTALGEDQIRAQAPHTLQDLNGMAPNVFIGMGTAGPAQSAIYIRGQGYADVEKTQSPPVGVIQDGVFFGNNTGQLLDMFDVCSVEVDRGPQGIFYGKNTTAGLINITRCAPSRQFDIAISAGYGSYDDEFVRGILNLPLGDKGGLKISAQWHENGGYYKDVYTGKNAGGDDYTAIHVVANYDLLDWLNVNLSYDRMHDNGGGEPVQFGDVLSANVLSGGNPALVWPHYNAQTGSPDGLKPWQIENRAGGDSDRYNDDIYSMTLKGDLGFGQLVSQTSYMNEADDVNQAFDGTCFVAPATPGPGCTSVGNPLLASAGGYLETIRDQTYGQFTEEARLAGTIFDNFDYLGGLFFYHHNITLHQNTDVAVDQFSGEEDSSWSFFGNLDWNLFDSVKLSAGLRDINESKHFRTFYEANVPGIGEVPITPHISDRKSWSKLITRFNAQWSFTDNNLIYANRSEGFRSGGFSMRGTLSEQNGTQSNCGVVAGCPNNNFLSFQPETNITYEVGSKNQFFDKSLTFNIDGFINDITGYQQSEVVVTPGYGSGTNTYIVNYPKVRIQGIEFEADAAVGSWIDALDGLTLTGNVGIQNAKVKNGIINGQEVALGAGATAGAPGSVADFTGSTLQRIPGNNYTLRGTYVRSVGTDSDVVLSMGYSWIAKFSLGNFGTVQDYQTGYGLLDASAQLDYQNYYLRLSGKNLTDEAYRDQSLPTVFFQGWGAPRTIEVEVGAKF